MNKINFCHPEARLDIIKAYHKLREKNITCANGNVLWDMARDWAHVDHLADTMTFKAKYSLQ